MGFVHLHTHSEYSLLDGANRIDDLIARAQEFEQPALAITDHGNLHAAWEFQEKAKKAKLKPIIGMEAYVARGDRRDRSRAAAGEKNYYHLVLLARDLEGYRNLVKLSSLGYTEGFYGKPRVDRELLARHNSGLIVSSACMAGEVAQHLLEDRYDEAKAVAAWYAEVFKDRYHLEVQAHEAGEQQKLNKLIFKLAEEMNLPVVATNDAHFLKAEDHDAHDVLLCIGLKKDRLDADRMRYDRGLYFKSAPEIQAHFKGRTDVLENTLKIADEVNVVFDKKYYVPSFPLPAGVSSENDFLVKLATDGAKQRYGDPLPADVKERLDYELGVITKTGYAGYFLITADFIKAARDRGIPVGPGRGSAAGSLVAYATGITNVCPLKFDLLFERFLNPERVSMPDIDVDFCEERRGEVIEYVRDKYGRESVGQIITFGTLKSRACIKDVGRVLGFTPAETDAIAKLIPNAPNFSLTVAEAIEKVPEVRKLYEQDERHAQLFDFAISLEGLSRHAGVHAAGIVIAPGPLEEYVPVCTQESKGSGSGNDERVVVTQYDMVALEKAGMLKMDFLGLTTLTILTDAVKAIKERRGVDIDLDALALDDEPTYRMLRAGRTAGVFQFESPLATEMVRAMRADRFDDLVASNALMRPGPLDAGMHKVYQRRKKGEEPVTYQLPELEEILAPTYGVITYQEQVMRIAQRLAGISLAEADVLRKAVGKKDAELIKAELGKFSQKAIANGFPAKVIEDISAQIETFGRYGFNKSHSVAYSVLSYHTAYLKAHYAPEFMAAVLSASIGDTDAVVKYINEARDLGLEILAPDVNESGWKFTVVGDTRIRFGLGAIRNVGHSAAESIIAARSEKPFTSLYDLCERVDLRVCNKRVFEALIHAGALDNLPGHRAQFLAALDGAMQHASLAQAEIATGQGSLFGDLGGDPSETPSAPLVPTLPNVKEFTESERLTQEKAILGFYISGHPLEPFRAECELLATHQVNQLGTWSAESMALAGVVTSVKRQISKKSGNEFARLVVEDFSGTAEILVFPEAWAAMSDRVQTDIPVLIKGAYGRRDQGADNPTFIVESITRLAELRATGQFAISLELDPAAGLPVAVMQDVRAVADAHPGSAPLELRWKGPDGSPARLRSSSLKLSTAGPALLELRALLGPERVRLVRGS
ncbi:DNA polymerase III subunit alpha [Pseudogemmatithrix spongiicola]|uniref:DNA polymerase III subunit alpha n=1 Tax=Pseudogemmatithrix spongiicola TaxID=3062599 RepID=A0AA49JSS3_9BACT|nr:DNA polymerase III subunit alpha [Gemmatimonadaceae bacterium 'strain 138']WKW14183.1 DNA polymerase III subunit alpha [Gemmatimonadaceae bacterium 'strain 318']